MQWHGSEEECYSYKALLAISLSNLPQNATACRKWGSHLMAQFGGIDRTKSNFLTKWLAQALELQTTNERSSEQEIIDLFDGDSGNLDLLDRHLGTLMLSQENLNNAEFGLKFNNYAQRCQIRRQAPKGRVLVALVALRFRVDRQRGRVLSQVQIYKLELKSYKIKDIREFLHQLELILGHITSSELKDPETLGQWMFDKFRSWSAIKLEIEAIKKDPKLKTLEHVRDVVLNHINDSFEDTNYFDIERGTIGTKPYALADKDSSSAKGGASQDKDKGKGKGKGKEKGKKGKGKGKDKDKGSSDAGPKAKAKGQPVPKAAAQQPQQSAPPPPPKSEDVRPASTLTLAEKAKLPCLRLVYKGTCKFGKDCQRSAAEGLCEGCIHSRSCRFNRSFLDSVRQRIKRSSFARRS